MPLLGYNQLISLVAMLVLGFGLKAKFIGLGLGLGLGLGNVRFWRWFGVRLWCKLQDQNLWKVMREGKLSQLVVIKVVFVA